MLRVKNSDPKYSVVFVRDKSRGGVAVVCLMVLFVALLNVLVAASVLPRVPQTENDTTVLEKVQLAFIRFGFDISFAVVVLPDAANDLPRVNGKRSRTTS